MKSKNVLDNIIDYVLNKFVLQVPFLLKFIKSKDLYDFLQGGFFYKTVYVFSVEKFF